MDNKFKKIKLKFIVFFVAVLISAGFLFFSYPFLKQTALALSSNYGKIGGDLYFDEWNNLPNDFLAKTGDTPMEGDLNMDAHRIINLNTIAAPGPNDAANVNYVDSSISASQGGDTYINWGRESCSGTDVLLYHGYGFGSVYSVNSGGDNPICVQFPADAEFFNGGARTDSLSPLVTGGSAQLPTSAVDPSSTISQQMFIKCALCYRNNSSCYENYGTHNCAAASFNYKAYDGYLVGGISSNHRFSTERACLNRNFDASESSPSWGAIWYGSRIEDNFGLANYTTSPTSFVKCSMCCN